MFCFLNYCLAEEWGGGVRIEFNPILGSYLKHMFNMFIRNYVYIIIKS